MFTIKLGNVCWIKDYLSYIFNDSEDDDVFPGNIDRDPDYIEDKSDKILSHYDFYYSKIPCTNFVKLF